MAISEPYELDGVSVTATPLSVPSGTTTPSTITDDGVYQFWLDPVTDMVKGDELEIRILEKVEGTGGTQRTVFLATLLGVQSELFVTPALVLINGWDILLDCLAGTSITVDASVRKIA